MRSALGAYHTPQATALHSVNQLTRLGPFFAQLPEINHNTGDALHRVH